MTFFEPFNQKVPVCDKINEPSLPARRLSAEGDARPVSSLLGGETHRPLLLCSLANRLQIETQPYSEGHFFSRLQTPRM
jgi:hypothetical protein